MPELPEVETVLLGLKPHLQHQFIKHVTVRHYGLRWPIPINIEQLLIGKQIQDIERRAKYLLLKINPGTLILHLGMSGRLRIITDNSLPKKHDHVDIELANHKILRFTDPRRFGAILWTEDNVCMHPLLKNLGIEPLEKGFSGKYLWQSAQGRKIAIKSFIMNQTIVVGIGNIYAAEALFEAGISPLTTVNNISLENFNRVANAIQKILRQAIKKGGTTLKDFINSDGKPGYFVNRLKVYGRKGLPCVKCHATLIKICMNQRSTMYCQNCQV